MPTVIGIIVLVAVIAVLSVALYNQGRRSKHLREQFGPECARLAQIEGTKATERELQTRESRVAKFHIPSVERGKSRSLQPLAEVQAEFVENPKGLLAHMDDLLGALMTARGYPVQDSSSARPIYQQNIRLWSSITTPPTA